MKTPTTITEQYNFAQMNYITDLYFEAKKDKPNMMMTEFIMVHYLETRYEMSFKQYYAGLGHRLKWGEAETKVHWGELDIAQHRQGLEKRL
jgi:hypothetical protein